TFSVAAAGVAAAHCLAGQSVYDTHHELDAPRRTRPHRAPVEDAGDLPEFSYFGPDIGGYVVNWVIEEIESFHAKLDSDALAHREFFLQRRVDLVVAGAERD